MKNLFEIENHTSIEMTEQVAKIIGPIAHKLSKINLLDDFKKEFIDFYDEICDHDELNIQLLSVYNFPCFHLLFREEQADLDINFSKLYSNFLGAEKKVRRAAAKSLHEAFALLNEDDDTTEWRAAFLDLLSDNNPKIMQIMNKQLSKIILGYVNKQMHGTVISPKTNTSNTDIDVPKQTKDFTSMIEPKYYKRRSTLHVTPSDINSEESDSNKRANIFASEEHHGLEIIYNDFLETLMIFVTNVKNIDGGWRHHLKLIQNL
jgi:hypothetical protein